LDLLTYSIYIFVSLTRLFLNLYTAHSDVGGTDLNISILMGLFSSLLLYVFFCLGVSRPVLFYPNISVHMGLFSSLFLSGFFWLGSFMFRFDPNISVLVK
jgi:hypothetical protein